jgi:hypothetical protein
VNDQVSAHGWRTRHPQGLLEDEAAEPISGGYGFRKDGPAPRPGSGLDFDRWKVTPLGLQLVEWCDDQMTERNAGA